ncbi:hypothetical protein SAMN06297251_10437 [Fulvimarina manganoxydans]|uniref:Holliday junction resolvase RuvC n=1 Tax=Fulvimarina manganoxydans TaxID=937218 RepID=A0A1W2A8Q6_9HYPH|nr:hypothetical protein [Fulvimarina manganoxydans]SMC57047.1 hypothetical protein SAMN06297251_10437 [Fulvimarina manganoxydans]
MRTLAFDQATHTGYAILDVGGIVAAGSLDLGAGIRTSGRNAVPTDVQHVLKCRVLRDLAAELIERHDIECVACERDFGRGVGGRLLVSLYTAIQDAAYSAGLPCLGIRIGDWRRSMHGTAGRTGKWQKAQAVAACAELGWALDEDAAEAVQIARYVRKRVRIVPDKPSSRRAAA